MLVSLSVLLLLTAVVFLLFKVGTIRVGYEGESQDRTLRRSGMLPFGCILCWFKYSKLPWSLYQVMPGSWPALMTYPRTGWRVHPTQVARGTGQATLAVLSFLNIIICCDGIFVLPCLCLFLSHGVFTVSVKVTAMSTLLVYCPYRLMTDPPGLSLSGLAIPSHQGVGGTRGSP